MRKVEIVSVTDEHISAILRMSARQTTMSLWLPLG